MPRRGRPSFVAGVALVALGLLLLLDATGTFTLGFAWLTPAVCAVLGATLVATGLTRRP